MGFPFPYTKDERVCPIPTSRSKNKLRAVEKRIMTATARESRAQRQGGEMNAHSMLRRRLLTTTAAVLAAPYVHTSRAAGSLAVGFWDHWVPGANDVLAKLCNEWAAKEKVDIKIDFITSVGSKIALTITSEGQAKSGHDVLSFGQWLAAGQVAN